MRLPDKKPCLNSMASQHHNYSTAGDLFLWYLDFALEIPWPNRACWVHGSWAPGEHVALPSEPSGFTGSPVPCKCFFWGPWTRQGMIDVWLSITLCWKAAFQPSTETRQKETWGRRGCKEHKTGRNCGMRDGSKRVLMARLTGEHAERHCLKWLVKRNWGPHSLLTMGQDVSS